MGRGHKAPLPYPFGHLTFENHCAVGAERDPMDFMKIMMIVFIVAEILAIISIMTLEGSC